MNTPNQLNNQGLITGHLTRLTLSFVCMDIPTTQREPSAADESESHRYLLVPNYILKPQYVNTQKNPSTKSFAKDGGMVLLLISY